MKPSAIQGLQGRHPRTVWESKRLSWMLPEVFLRGAGPELCSEDTGTGAKEALVGPPDLLNVTISSYSKAPRAEWLGGAQL